MTQTITPTAAGDAAPARTMTTTTASDSPRVSKGAWWAGWILSGLVILWIAVIGTVFSLTMPEMVEQNMAKYGYPASTVTPIHIVAVACVILYAIPRTAVLGAILLTGYLGGAVATHVRFGDAWSLPVIFGVLVWLGLFLRDRRVRDLIPLRKA
jgi:hypothetical protein